MRSPPAMALLILVVSCALARPLAADEPPNKRLLLRVQDRSQAAHAGTKGCAEALKAQLGKLGLISLAYDPSKSDALIQVARDFGVGQVAVASVRAWDGGPMTGRSTVVFQAEASLEIVDVQSGEIIVAASSPGTAYERGAKEGRSAAMQAACKKVALRVTAALGGRWGINAPPPADLAKTCKAGRLEACDQLAAQRREPKTQLAGYAKACRRGELEACRVWACASLPHGDVRPNPAPDACRGGHHQVRWRAMAEMVERSLARVDRGAERKALRAHLAKLRWEACFDERGESTCPRPKRANTTGKRETPGPKRYVLEARNASTEDGGIGCGAALINELAASDLIPIAFDPAQGPLAGVARELGVELAVSVSTKAWDGRPTGANNTRYVHASATAQVRDVESGSVIGSKSVTTSSMHLYPETGRAKAIENACQELGQELAADLGWRLGVPGAQPPLQTITKDCDRGDEPACEILIALGRRKAESAPKKRRPEPEPPRAPAPPRAVPPPPTPSGPPQVDTGPTSVWRQKVFGSQGVVVAEHPVPCPPPSMAYPPRGAIRVTVARDSRLEIAGKPVAVFLRGHEPVRVHLSLHGPQGLLLEQEVDYEPSRMPPWNSCDGSRIPCDPAPDPHDRRTRVELGRSFEPGTHRVIAKAKVLGEYVLPVCVVDLGIVLADGLHKHYSLQACNMTSLAVLKMPLRPGDPPLSWSVARYRDERSGQELEIAVSEHARGADSFLWGEERPLREVEADGVEIAVWRSRGKVVVVSGLPVLVSSIRDARCTEKALSKYQRRYAVQRPAR